MKLAFPISRNFDLLQPTSGGHQITGIGAIAIPFAFGTTLSPGCSNELVELFTHHRFDHGPNGTLGERPQVLMEDLLLW
jgi:hypothetical protein